MRGGTILQPLMRYHDTVLQTSANAASFQYNPNNKVQLNYSIANERSVQQNRKVRRHKIHRHNSTWLQFIPRRRLGHEHYRCITEGAFFYVHGT